MNDHITFSIYELFAKFADNNSARLFFEKIRWNGRVVCPVCGSTHITTRGGSRVGIYRCNDCKKEFSVRTNSVMEHSNIPLHKWLLAMYVFVTKRNGISSLELSKEISVTQKSAWYLLHRIRLAAGNGDALLKGIIEADETYIGGKEKHKHSIKKSHAGRGAAGKTPVFGMIKRNGRVVMKVVDNTKAETLFSLFKKHVKSESEIYTDEFTSYDNLAKFGYDHERVNHSAGKYVDGEVHTNTIESVWSNLKRSIYGTYISVSIKHLQKYADETAFRLNEGNCKIKTVKRIETLITKMFGIITRYDVMTGKRQFIKDICPEFCECAVTYSENLIVRKAA